MKFSSRNPPGMRSTFPRQECDKKRYFGFALLAGSLTLTEAQAGDCRSICPVQALPFPFGHVPPHMPAMSRRAGIQALPTLSNCHNFALHYGDLSGPNKQTLYGKFDWDVAQSKHTVTASPKHPTCTTPRHSITLLREKRCHKKKGLGSEQL